MKVENKRIFISDLPETAAPAELQSIIKNYGTPTSVEIKERKELGPKNHSLFFSYINVEIDDRSLQKCFNDFASGKYFGQRIILQIARESFLDRLKREREESGVPQKSVNISTPPITEECTNKFKGTNNLRPESVQENEFSETTESEESSEEEKEKVPIRETKNICVKEDNIEIDTLDLVIKSNKGKVLGPNGLKIESVGNSPIMIIDKSKKKPVVNKSESNLKRLQALNSLKKSYKTQKSIIQQALSKVDTSSNKKIIFDETENVSKNQPKKSKQSLFDDEDQEDDFEPSFDIKEQFQGKKGQKLLELQTKYKNDKRFALDARFLENDEGEDTGNQVENGEDISLEDEKKKELEILGEILGQKVVPKYLHKNTESESSKKKSMIRYDPTNPEHSKFEIKNETKKEKKKKRKRENSESDMKEEKKRVEPEAPEVSKEVFYKVTTDLKDSLKDKREFSLLGAFGKADEKEQSEDEGAKKITRSVNNFTKERNPFRYDSSDDEDETEEVPNGEVVQPTEKSSEAPQPSNNRSQWHEPFFFTDDDYRLQEGIDFVERIASKVYTNEEFAKVRRDLRATVRAKVRNCQRKNKPFKKKLGGSRKKKVLRIKKALKR